MSRATLLLALAAVLGCRSDGSSTSGASKTYSGAYPIRAVCTTGMVADLIRNVGGPHVAIEQLLGHDIDPHQYKPTPGDVRKLKGGDIVFYSGLHLEGKMTDVFESMARSVPSIAVAERVGPDKLLKDDEGAMDPHLWFDVRLWAEAAGVVRDALAGFDPKHAEDYRAACAAYQKELGELHEYARKRIGEIDPKQRVLITSHDAFQYFGRAYEVEVKGIQGISTESEASVGHITRLVDFIVERKVKAVFVETSVNERNMQALIDGCRAKGHAVRNGGTLFSDAMGPAGEKTGTYAGMIRHNVDTIVGALK
jgi:manganese/zinc/iron transport system substrate-binding protein